MKTTLEIPDELYRQVKAKSALEGRRVREVTISLYENWLRGGGTAAQQKTEATNWLDDLMKHSMPAGLPGPTVREILEEDRNRLEPKQQAS